VWLKGNGNCISIEEFRKACRSALKWNPAHKTSESQRRL
jgi:hypothetical protein